MNRYTCSVISALAFAVLAAPAVAHITIAPSALGAGIVDEITFRCPDERSNSATTKLVIQMPQDHPIASVKLRPVPGWRSSVTMQKLKVPLKTQHGEMVAAVDTITWQGGSIAPGEYQDFAILAGPIPAGVKQLVFKAVQTYANGEVVRWIELRHAGEPEPAHPAPILDVK
jgi:periplasmic copper chaperone A